MDIMHAWSTFRHVYSVRKVHSAWLSGVRRWAFGHSNVVNAFHTKRFPHLHVALYFIAWKLRVLNVPHSHFHRSKTGCWFASIYAAFENIPLCHRFDEFK